MKIRVMKFGGSSVANPEKILRAAALAINERRRGYAVVVVVSAPGDTTDDLLKLAAAVAPHPDERELDQLLATGEQTGIALFALACRSQGTPAISLTGPQAGIEAHGEHTRARISRIRCQKILSELKNGRIVVVAGFQGLSGNDDITTLGRGGSDLTAVALAGALKTQECDIYTDVRGVYTADPRLVANARQLKRITGGEMLELAGAGAQVMQARSIEVAQHFGVSIRVRSALEPDMPGTWIVPLEEENTMLEKAYVSSLALDKSEVRLTLVNVPDRPGTAARAISALAKRDIPIDMIIQSAPSQSGVNDISLMTPRAYVAQARRILGSVAREMKAGRLDVHDKVAKISAVGIGFRHHPWVAAKIFETLAKNKINIHMIVASDLRVSCIVDGRHGATALRVLHKAFNLAEK